MLESIISKLVALGADLNSRSAIKKALNVIGESEVYVDYIYILVKNNAFRKEWSQTPVKKRLVFLPQCLRNSKKCKAELTEYGYICKKCGSCSIFEIVSYPALKCGASPVPPAFTADGFMREFGGFTAPPSHRTRYPMGYTLLISFPCHRKHSIFS